MVKYMVLYRPTASIYTVTLIAKIEIIEIGTITTTWVAFNATPILSSLFANVQQCF